jgi:hypothetical protein
MEEEEGFAKSPKKLRLKYKPGDFGDGAGF